MEVLRSGCSSKWISNAKKYCSVHETHCSIRLKDLRCTLMILWLTVSAIRWLLPLLVLLFNVMYHPHHSTNSDECLRAIHSLSVYGWCRFDLCVRDENVFWVQFCFSYVKNWWISPSVSHSYKLLAAAKWWCSDYRVAIAWLPQVQFMFFRFPPECGWLQRQQNNTHARVWVYAYTLKGSVGWSQYLSLAWPMFTKHTHSLFFCLNSVFNRYFQRR